MPNHEELYFTPDINKPHQQWSVLEAPERPERPECGLIRRHYRQPGERPDAKTSFGISEVSPVLEHYAARAGVEYSRISLGRQSDSFDLALSIVQSGLGMSIHGTTWYPVIPWVRDEGFCAVLMRRPIPYEEACHLFGFDVPTAKPSVPKRIKRHLATGRTALFGSEAEVRQLNEYDRVHRAILADGVTTFETAVYDPGPRWPEAWTSGAALASRRGGALLTGHPVQIGDLIQITGALPSGQIKAHCLIWDVAHDLVVFDIKKELRSWHGEVYLSVLNELHGSPANLDVQTASNLDLAKVRDHKLIQYPQPGVCLRCVRADEGRRTRQGGNRVLQPQRLGRRRRQSGDERESLEALEDVFRRPAGDAIPQLPGCLLSHPNGVPTDTAIRIASAFAFGSPRIS